jgi:parallel beta-helix repeat protein
VRSDGAAITLDHVTIEKSFSTASSVRLVGASATLRDCVISESQTGLAIEGGSPTVERCTFANNQYGITATGGATPTLVDLTFTGNTHNTDPATLWP